MLATDTPTTLLAVAMTHYELPGLGLDGRNVDLVQIDAPFRSYLTSARALLRARSLEGLVGNWDRSDGLPPVLRLKFPGRKDKNLNRFKQIAQN